MLRLASVLRQREMMSSRCIPPHFHNESRDCPTDSHPCRVDRRFVQGCRDLFIAAAQFEPNDDGILFLRPQTRQCRLVSLDALTSYDYIER